ncbi:hypothetical protein [Actinomycetospora soli]|nr:hypothetical protein [Actinomycetospora soli]MCD2189878.1 hypothetical protein [Actinomycetospora soli]
MTEEDMYAEAHADPGGGERVAARNPDDAAMELLTQHLGARRVDGR